MKHTATLTAAVMGLALQGCAVGTVEPQAVFDLPRAQLAQMKINAPQEVPVLADVEPAAAPSVISNGKVLLTRDEEATPPPEEKEIAEKIQEAAATAVAVARQAAREEAEETRQIALHEVDQRFDKLAGRTDKLLDHTSEVLRNTATTQQAVNQQLGAQRQLADMAVSHAGLAVSQAELLNRQTQEEAQRKLAEAAAREEEITRHVASSLAEVAQRQREISSTLSSTLAEVEKRNRSLPVEVRAIAGKAVEEKVPELKAIALQSVKDSEGYIRTVARTAVQDDDPAMKEALANAARDVITRDNKVIFAIRSALASSSTRMGNDRGAEVADASADVEPAAGGPITDEVTVDSTKLGIAALLPPGSTLPKTDKLEGIEPAAGKLPVTFSRTRTGWVDLRKYRVVVHDDGKTLEELLGSVVKRAEPFSGPWRIKWKISEENKDILAEKFSLDVETSFEEFVSYLAQYLANDRGIKISFSLFDAERIIVVSD